MSGSEDVGGARPGASGGQSPPASGDPASGDAAAAPPPAAGPPWAAEPVPTTTDLPVTGLPAVDDVVRSLAQVASLPPAGQLPAFQAGHRTLRESLSRIDEQD